MHTSGKFAGSESAVKIGTDAWLLLQALSSTQYSLSNPGEEIRQKKVEVCFQEPQIQEGRLSERMAGIKWELEGATQEIQTRRKPKPLTQAKISQFPERWGQDPRKKSFALAFWGMAEWRGRGRHFPAVRRPQLLLRSCFSSRICAVC